MPWRLTRRGALHAGVGLAVRGASGVMSVAGQGDETDEGFDPATHGFGFRNWGTADQYIESPPDATQATLRDRVRSQWREQALASLDIDTTADADGALDRRSCQSLDCAAVAGGGVIGGIALGSAGVYAATAYRARADSVANSTDTEGEAR